MVHSSSDRRGGKLMKQKSLGLAFESCPYRPRMNSRVSIESGDELSVSAHPVNQFGIGHKQLPH